MAEGEFDLINHYFATSKQPSRSDVILSIGDDCAITQLKPNQRLAITTDTMVENSHFYPDIPPRALGYKAIATNLSDLAAMGARPAWVSLALTLPKIDTYWLSEFSQGMFDILNQYNVTLIGGDTTKGPIPTITITAHGILGDYALRRDQAKVEDWIYVTGQLGDALAGFYLSRDRQQGRKSAVANQENFFIQRNLYPVPRVEFGQVLAQHYLANAAMDLSDGLMGDLMHILERSHKSAVLNLENLPISPQLEAYYGREEAERMALQGGEDYELCFTVSDEQQAKLEQYLTPLNVPYTCIGRIIQQNSLQPIQLQRYNQKIELDIQSFDHFK
ncbi:thiamine-phosphate kinase [Pasteurella bettyae]|uniref:Thiamine-monophosphate kinase n=1 Tax=Pasteurella bettyae CCUG 2042 TaxID=1095749 RepID=I3DI17_9PAST|nr:thiamine-phosphate kinase [Pasteurella bettyae]EIJ71360.1 thiamine-phosphate kinase [Pasteurella bettyae CCUG 2042]SUB21570.1 thiamine-monophosphate kinase [Pasteurella bettyae]